MKKRQKRKHGGIVSLPHLNTNVVVIQKIKGDRDGCVAYVHRLCPEEYELHVPLPIRGPVSGKHLVHELIHILQFIVEDNSMDFTHERESLAYTADYLFHKISEM